MLLQPFDIGNQMGGCIGREVDAWLAGVRRASSGSALVEKHDSIPLRIKKAPHARRATGTRAPMKNEGGLASRIAARLPIDLVPVTGIEHPMIVGFYVRVQFRHCRGLHAEQ